MTPESFAQWKKTRLDKKAAELDALKRTKETQNAAGRVNGMSGRDLFDYRPEWFEEEDDEEGDAGTAEGGEWDIDRMRKETEEEAEREEGLRIEEMRQDFEATSVS